MKINFEYEGDFVARQKAEEFCERNFLSLGPVDGEKPRGIKVGKHNIAKWSELSKEDIGRLDGEMAPSLSNFTCIILADVAGYRQGGYRPGDLVCEVTRVGKEYSLWDGTPLVYFDEHERVLPPVFTVDTILAEHHDILVCEERDQNGILDFHQYEVKPKPIRVGDRVRSTASFMSPDEELTAIRVDGPFLCVEQKNGHVFRQHNIYAYRAVKKVSNG